MILLSSDWRRLAGQTLVIASLAMLATPAWAAGTAPAATQVPASRYAAKQVRVPQEKGPTVKPTGQSRGQVRPAAHTETVIQGRGMMRTPRDPAAYRTASRLRSTVGDEHSIVVQEGETIMQGEPLPSPEGDVIESGDMQHQIHSDHDGGCQGGGCQGGSCNDCNTCGRGNNCCLIPCPNINFDNFEFFAGADAFSGPLNRGQGGSFGFHEGVNWGGALPCQDVISAQLGFQAIQSSFSGNNVTDQDRRQFFVTGGFFRRVDWGLQGGAVVDFLHDEWYYDALDFAQVRGELSWVFPCNHEIGVWATHGLQSSSSNSVLQTSAVTTVSLSESWHANDLYTAFYRRKFEGGGAGRIFAGFTDHSDGLVGADFNVPLSECWALRTDFTYLIPSEGHSQNGNVEESYNVSLGLVWYPGARTARSCDYNRPLFNVANNGTFLIDRD